MSVQFLIFDLDGTAIPNRPDGMPSQKVLEAVKAAQQRIRVSVATGRGLEMCQPILKALHISEPCIVAGGTQLYDPVKNKFTWEQRLSAEQVAAIISACSQFSYTLEVAGETQSAPINQYQDIASKSILYIVNVPIGQETAVLEALRAVTDIVVHKVPAWVPNCYDLHISHIDATKKHALKVLLEREQINPEQVMMVGDGENDLPLFELAGLKVAMGNAAPALKHAADVVVGTVEEDGLAEAIERYLLNR